VRAATIAVPRWKDSPVEREPDDRSTRRSLGLVAAVVLTVSPILVYLVTQIRYLEIRYRVDEVRSQHERLVEAERRLRTERAELAALPGIEQRAARELGLVRPTPEEVLVLAPLQRHGGDNTRAPATHDDSR